VKETSNMKKTAFAIVIVLVVAAMAAGQTPQPQPQQPPAQAKPVTSSLPKTLYENLPSPMSAWISAYPDQPAERVTMVCLLRQMIEKIAEQQRTIGMLAQSVQQLQTQMANLPKPEKPVEPPVDKGDKPVDAQVEPKAPQEKGQ
jgi:tRNA C32,U32 (ribose-2'-O)-methylase TrmJ